MSTPLERLHAQVFGRVQGVSFRYNTMVVANRLGCAGWVRNLPDGSVEVCAEGSRALLDELLGYLRTGPTGARVTRVEFSWLTATGEFDFFQVT